MHAAASEGRPGPVELDGSRLSLRLPVEAEAEVCVDDETADLGRQE